MNKRNNRQSTKKPSVPPSSDLNDSPAIQPENEENKIGSEAVQTPKKNFHILNVREHYRKLREKYGKVIVDSCTVIGAIISLIALYLTLYPLGTKPAPPKTTQKKFTVLVPLASTSNEYNAFMQKKTGTYEEKYNNQASQNIRDIVKTAKTQWLKDNPNEKLKDDSIEFFCFPEGFDEDETSYRKAFNHAVEITTGNGREIVGLLGNVSSTSTLKYGDFCGITEKNKETANNNTTESNNTAESNNAKNNGIPMILPLATATSLMRNLELKKVPAILRLPPDNNKQAESISKFLLQKKVFKTVILKDLSNETYSSDLIENFRENYVQKPLSKMTSDFGEIVGTIPIGGKETSPFLYSALSGKTSGLVIAGMTNSAIETLAQAKASNSGFNAIVLTDGAVDEYLGKRIQKIQTENTIENLYLSFPSPCALDNALASYINGDSSLMTSINDFKFTHSLYVADGVYIIISALNSGVTKSADVAGSKIIVDFINNLKQKAEETEKDWIKKNPDKSLDLLPKGVSVDVPLPFNNNWKREYLIDKFGNNIKADYYLFKLDAESNWNPLGTQPTQNCFNQDTK